ncbi:MAG: aminopeptidase P family protein [Acidobacteriota bacterium]|nr:aminopeptidase P family protein [Acidobacteriota bacterium]
MNTKTEPVRHEARQQALQRQLNAHKTPFLVVTRPANIFYLTGFRGSAGIAIIGMKEAVLFVDPRYTLQSREQAHGVEIIETGASLLRTAGKWLRKRRAMRIGFEGEHLTVAQLERLRDAGPPSARWKPQDGVIEGLREVKDESEIELIRESCRLTSAAFEEVLPLVRPGISERDLASELDFRMMRRGADGPAFETIVASGARGALPHARPAAKLLVAGELVILDLGAILGGYAADMTRTVYLGAPGRKAQFLYKSVLRAQGDAIASLGASVQAGTVDAAARRRLARNNLNQLFTHSTGHGLGVEVHERPRIGKGERSRIPAGSVVTIEPGIYIEGWGGIRIEDSVLVSETGAEILTAAAKDRWFTG